MPEHLVEAKAVDQTNGAVLDQVLKYVDFIARDRASGDFAKVDAYIVAPRFGKKLLAAYEDRGRPQYRPPERHAVTQTWHGLRLIQVAYESGGSIGLEDVTP